MKLEVNNTTHSIDKEKLKVKQMALNLNIGILGHVDSGKTSLAKALSEVASTAAFDKDPQSQNRGITLDLGFSSFSIVTPSSLQDQTLASKLQYTLVDCPGHASLIRTVIGGAQIIDMILLVIDITKGIQTQTAECLVIGEITCKRMIIVLNKVDLIPEHKQSNFIDKVRKKIKLTLVDTIFQDSPVVAVSVNPNLDYMGIPNLIEEIAKYSFIPDRKLSGPFLFAVDHCFGIKGQGTILTGTVLQGCTSVNDIIEIPIMNIQRKIKSIQVFKKPTTTISQGDRAGICVTQFESKQLERGLICAPNSTKFITCGIIFVNKIKYFKYPINSKSKFHITIGHETTMGTITIFASKAVNDFHLHEEYEFINNLEPSSDECNSNLKYFMLIEFDKPVLAFENSLTIGSKLDINMNSNTCRIAFWGRLLHSCKDRDYKISFLPKLKIFKIKNKIGVIERIVDKNTAIVKNMFKKETHLEPFIGMKVETSFGDIGKIECSFGKSGKVKVRFENKFNEKFGGALKHRDTELGNHNTKIEIFLSFKKHIYDVNKKILQYNVVCFTYFQS